MSNEQQTSGSFLSFGGLIILALAFGGLGMLVDALGYSASDPIEVKSVADLSDLEAGDFALFRGTLDYEHAILSDKVVGDSYLLAPVVGTEFTFWVSQKDGVIPPAAEEISFAGRVVTRGSSGWEVGDARDVDLTYHAKKLFGVETPRTALVLQDGVKPGDDMTEAWIIGGISILVLLVWAGRVISFVVSLVRPKANVSIA